MQPYNPGEEEKGATDRGQIGTPCPIMAPRVSHPG
jgi:hypothetical protein